MFITDWYHAIRCRVIYHPHRLHIHHPEITGWSWRDRDMILLCANFQILVDFVELELPHFSRWCGVGEAWETRLQKIPLLSWFLDTRRNPAAGIAHLEWAMGLDNPVSQAEHAKEQLALYRWWTQERPNRPDPWEEVSNRPEGSLNALFDSTITSPEKEAYFESLHKAGAIEDAYHEEDTAQLIRLMKIRRGLWT